MTKVEHTYRNKVISSEDYLNLTNSFLDWAEKMDNKWAHVCCISERPIDYNEMYGVNDNNDSDGG